MDKNTPLAKTEKGRDAMARRVPELVPRLRSMLILVDGKRTVSELDKLGAALGGGMALLEQLVAHGWVGPADGSSPPSPTPATTPTFADSQPFPVTAPTPVTAAAPAASPVAASTLAFADARRLVVRFINDAVGPMGEQTAIRVESCKTAAELQSLLPRIRDALQNYRGKALVQRFDLEIVPQLPRA
jgi:hypothetical protein